jgi:integrase
MGLYKICPHKGRARDRCDHPWWGSFRGKRVSLARWANRDIGSKTDAASVLDKLRAAVRAGTFDERGMDYHPEPSPLTFRAFAEVYKARHVVAKGLALASTIDYRLKPLLERFGDRQLAEIRTADIEDFVADLKKPRVVNTIEGRTLTPASINRTLGLLRHMLNWAVGREYLERTPFRRGTEVLIRLEREDNKRRRRVSDEEEAALLGAASPHLRSMIIAALDTGMRRGEMLALRLGDIDWNRRLIVLRGATTKSRRTRVVPIGTSRLLAVLEWQKLDSTGEEKKADALVFSNEVGESLKTFKKAWVVAVLKAHNADPHWRKGQYKDLTTESQKRFREVNLHWHDLRHEYASRLVERGVPLAQVRDLLGHASILTTERYDNQRLEALQAAAARLEAGKAFDAVTHGVADVSAVAIPPEIAKAEVSSFFQVPAEETSAQSSGPAAKSARSN